MKYIDADKLKAEIERLKEKYLLERWDSNYDTIAAQYKVDAYNELLPLIKSLEKEPEVNFEKEFAKFSNDPDAEDYAFPIDLADYKDFARHFYELGLKARKED